MTENNEEEYDGVTLTVSTDDWPKGLAGIVIKEQHVYQKDNTVKIIGDPIWSLEELSDEL